MLKSNGASQAYITPYDFSMIVECNNEDDVDEEFIQKLLYARSSEVPEVNERAIGYDVWSKMLLQSGILDKDDNKYLVVKNDRLVDWILDSYNKNIKNNGKVNNGILEYLPIIPTHSIEGYADEYSTESAFIISFLF